ncbi:Csu type fimbrial protein [Methylibium sp.]|uniref:Csu type fimbrial protein n=1 Tax=Methylibium sp. TaxID=2067992 RepID=UPI003D115DF0
MRTRRRDSTAPGPLIPRLRWLATALALAGPLLADEARASCTALGLVTCSMTVTATALAFGTYNPNAPAGASDLSSTIDITGTVFGVGLLTTLSYTVSLSAGTGGTVADRKLLGSGGSLSYNLYTDSNRSTVWNTVADSIQALATILGTSTNRQYTVYGAIPPGQYLAPGLYSDTIVVTITH